MDEDTIENIRYKFELEKLICDKVSPSSYVINTEIRSDPSVNDLDLLSSMPSPDLQEGKVDNDISFSDLYDKDIDEAKLKEKNVDLYNDLEKIEEEERKAKQIQETEFENCQQELKKLKDSDVKNERRIEELTRENTNLKKSVSSLYRTAKREIDFKDKSLAEANSEIIRLKNKLHYKNVQFPKSEKSLNCENNSIDSRKGSSTAKRKRSKSPESSSKKSERRSSTSTTYETDLQSERDDRKTEKRSEHGATKSHHSSDSRSERDKRKSEKMSEHRTAKSSHSSDLPNNRDKKDSSRKEISKVLKYDKETQTSNQCVFCQSHLNSNAEKVSRDSREINDTFFNLLPDSLKESFYEYEKDQIISLNKLKQSFIDEYFNSVADAPSSILESTSKTQDIPAELSTSSKSTANKSSSKTSSTPTSSSEHCKSTANKSSSKTSSTTTSSSEHCKSTELDEKFRKNELNENLIQLKKGSAHDKAPIVIKNCTISRSNKKDLISLFMYRKEKIPFRERKKFGLLKEGQKLIPEKLL